MKIKQFLRRAFCLNRLIEANRLELERLRGIAESYTAIDLSREQVFEREIARWKLSGVRQAQIIGDRYYRGRQDILERERTVIGRDGQLETVRNLPNNRIVDNQYAKMVDQKTNYLFGKPFILKTDNEAYEEALKTVFDKRFCRLLQNLGEDSLNGGIGWLYVYYDGGSLRFRRFKPYEILPFWKDAEHTVLDCAVRVYEVESYEGQDLTLLEKAEIYRDSGIEYYDLTDGVLIPDTGIGRKNYLTTEAGAAFNWERIPIIPFKYNNEEIPLICKVKSLQDGLNTALSDFQNNMQEDSRNTILIISNYDGENLADFRYNLAQFGAVKVKTIDGAAGGVDALQVEVASENYKALLDLFKKAIIENAMGYDAKDDRMAGSPNQMNILSMYSDIDLDANGMETEYQASFEDLMFFVNAHLANTGGGSFEDAELEIVFNRDIMMNETDVIANVKASVGIVSTETLLAKHPWVEDVTAETERLDKEKQEAMDAFAETLPGGKGGEAPPLGG